MRVSRWWKRELLEAGGSGITVLPRAGHVSILIIQVNTICVDLSGLVCYSWKSVGEHQESSTASPCCMRCILTLSGQTKGRDGIDRQYNTDECIYSNRIICYTASAEMFGSALILMPEAQLDRRFPSSGGNRFSDFGRCYTIDLPHPLPSPC